MPAGRLNVLYEDNHLLAINKPPGLPTMGVAVGDSSLIVLAKQYIKRRYRKPGNVYLGIVSRLDATSSGIVLLARTSKAAARLTEQFRERKVHKTYWAIIPGSIDPPAGELVDWLIKDEPRQRMTVVKSETPQAKEARLKYRVVREVPGGSLLEIELETGRKHQIRVQFAARGYPLWGEPKYGRGAPFGDGVALHARRLLIEHPVNKQPLELIAPPGAAWRGLTPE